MHELFDIAGKTALVTGGANGLGRMIAEGLLEAGVKVYITSRKTDEAEKAQQEMNELGVCVALSADLSTADGAVKLADEIKSHEAKLHILVNNAGRTWGAALESFPDKAWSPVMSVNVQAPFTLVRELQPLLRTAASEQDPARVINLGSVAGAVVEPIPAYSYAASKAAIHHLTRILAAELAGQHITVNVVIPGYFPTKMTTHIRNNDSELEDLVQRVPLRRLGNANDIAGLCIFLASRAASYMTGAEFFIDGGMAGCR
jgi:NAD(P)-dependent dehydrogenase (short-subunit alcohol dehydrogenase family)